MEEAHLAPSVRVPRQGRSKASYERMLVAAEELLVTKGGEAFTLSEVSRLGQVSIGSIYCRFESKDALVQSVQLRVLDRVDTRMLTQVVAAREAAGSLVAIVPLLVEAVAETLREHAPLLRPLMQRATHDPIVAQTGKASYASTAAAVRSALLAHRAEIRQDDPERAVDSCFRVLYAAIARYLGFGSAKEAAWEGRWDVLKQDLGRMLAAFLMMPSA
ncbi:MULTISPECIES: TetR/AcrR family transcriptional regulator [unclassified Novosphingobium]|uniref:TetR/AcrR family transcriptional regulator n=1 Tax=Novosphingobium TaxID=165696 RepID=UPI00146C6D06|nr:MULTISPECIES: TetR/AcrR family transcriptional regulator [unclassified Novosphingobium]NMN03540.1 AcrR family transcriptional regulator [Novosphingobium sp. SG919]